MTAEECLQHDWLKKKRPAVQRINSMDVAKDNLRQFVERWNEHPNSPYVFEISNGIVPDQDTGSGSFSESSHSLLGDSPSPCGSIASSPGNDNIFINNVDRIDTSNNDLFMPPKSLLEVPTSDHIRRSSESSYFMKNQDISERINLAEEIRKLSDKLFRLSNMDTSLTNGLHPFDEEDSNKASTATKTVPINITNNSTSSLPKDHPQNPSCTIPWRKTKHKINANTSRDVPLSCRSIYKKADDDRLSNHTYKEHTIAQDANGTKDLLLRLLQNWDGPKGPVSRPNTRHGSLSAEWTEEDTLGQRTISSLNNFFQSRQTNKKITPFHFNKS